MSCYSTPIPDYLLDCALIINNSQERLVSSYKLSISSSYFDNQFRSEHHEPRRKAIQTHRRLDIQMCDSYVRAFNICLVLLHGEKYDLLEKHITEEDIKDLIAISNTYGIASVGRFVVRFAKENINFNNCWLFLDLSNDIFSRESAAELYELSFSYIAHHFQDLPKQGAFLRCTLHHLISLLSSDALYTKTEMGAFRAVEEWIQSEVIERTPYLRKLLMHVRLGRMSSDDLPIVRNSPLVQSQWEECEEIMMWSCLISAEAEIDNGTNVFELSPNTRTQMDSMRRLRLPREVIFVVGGWEGNQNDANFGPSKGVQVYNYHSNTWERYVTEPVALHQGHAYSGCVAYKTRIYVIGGYLQKNCDKQGPTQTTRMFNLQTMSWELLAPMHEKRNYVAAAELRGKIYALGGHNGHTRLRSVESYDPEINRWLDVASMAQVRSDSGCDTLDDKIFVCGGFDGHTFFSSVECYSYMTNQWTMACPMSSVRSGVSAVAFGGALYAIGGNDGHTRLNTVELYDPRLDSWNPMPHMQLQRSNFCVAVLEGELYAIGGWSDATQSTISLVEKWRPGKTNAWEHVNEITFPASANTCCTVKGTSTIERILEFAKRQEVEENIHIVEASPMTE